MGKTKMLSMNMDLYITDKDKYEDIHQECLRFKEKIMGKLEEYDFDYPEKIDFTIRSVGGMAP